MPRGGQLPNNKLDARPLSTCLKRWEHRTNTRSLQLVNGVEVDPGHQPPPTGCRGATMAKAARFWRVLRPAGLVWACLCLLVHQGEQHPRHHAPGSEQQFTIVIAQPSSRGLATVAWGKQGQAHGGSMAAQHALHASLQTRCHPVPKWPCSQTHHELYNTAVHVVTLFHIVMLHTCCGGSDSAPSAKRIDMHH